MPDEVQAFMSGGLASKMGASKQVHAVLGTGAADIASARQALASVAGSKAFAVDPELVNQMVKKLVEMDDHLQKIVRNAQLLSEDTKLGDGYARVISTNNSQFGEVATGQIRDIQREIHGLKTQLEKSRDSYRNVDQTHSDSLKKLNGKS